MAEEKKAKPATGELSVLVAACGVLIEKDYTDKCQQVERMERRISEMEKKLENAADLQRIVAWKMHISGEWGVRGLQWLLRQYNTLVVECTCQNCLSFNHSLKLTQAHWLQLYEREEHAEMKESLGESIDFHQYGEGKRIMDEKVKYGILHRDPVDKCRMMKRLKELIQEFKLPDVTSDDLTFGMLSVGSLCEPDTGWMEKLHALSYKTQVATLYPFCHRMASEFEPGIADDFETAFGLPQGPSLLP